MNMNCTSMIYYFKIFSCDMFLYKITWELEVVLLLRYLAPLWYIFGILRSIWTWIRKEREVINGKSSITGRALNIQSKVSVGLHCDLASVPLWPRCVEPCGRQVPDSGLIAILIIIICSIDRFLVNPHTGGV